MASRHDLDRGNRRPLAAAILTGGAARRMEGRPKGLLAVDGVSIVERQLPVLRGLADPVFLVGSTPEPYAHLAIDIVADCIPGRGALGGIYTAILKAPTDRVLVVACDMPFLSAPLLQMMSALTHADVVVPRSARGLEPLCAIYSRACAEPIRDRLERGALEASVLPEGMLVEEIDPAVIAAYDPDGLLFVNVNTPHDYERARKLVDPASKARRDRIMEDP